MPTLVRNRSMRVASRLSGSGHTPRRINAAGALPSLHREQSGGQTKPQQAALQPWTEEHLIEALAVDQHRMVLERYYQDKPPAGMSVLRSGTATQVGTARGSQAPGAATTPRHVPSSLLYKERELERLHASGVRGGKPPNVPSAGHVAFRKPAQPPPRTRFLVLQETPSNGCCLDYFDSCAAASLTAQKRTGATLSLVGAMVSRNERVLTVTAWLQTSGSSAAAADRTHLHFEFETSRAAQEWEEALARATEEPEQRQLQPQVSFAAQRRPQVQAAAETQETTPTAADQEEKMSARLHQETEHIIARNRREAERKAREKAARLQDRAIQVEKQRRAEEAARKQRLAENVAEARNMMQELRLARAEKQRVKSTSNRTSSSKRSGIPEAQQAEANIVSETAQARERRTHHAAVAKRRAALERERKKEQDAKKRAIKAEARESEARKKREQDQLKRQQAQLKRQEDDAWQVQQELEHEENIRDKNIRQLVGADEREENFFKRQAARSGVTILKLGHMYKVDSPEQRRYVVLEERAEGALDVSLDFFDSTDDRRKAGELPLSHARVEREDQSLFVTVNEYVHPHCSVSGTRVGFMCSTVEAAMEWYQAIADAVEKAEQTWWGVSKQFLREEFKRWQKEHEGVEPGDEVLVSDYVEQLKRRIRKQQLQELPRRNLCGKECVPYIHTLVEVEKIGKPWRRPKVGKATVFLSHPWHMPMKHFFEAALQSLDNSDYAWVDFFCRNQFADREGSSRYWIGEFASPLAVVNDIPKVIAIVGSDWAAPFAITRLWCLMEMACATRTQTELEIVMTERQRSDLLSAVMIDDGRVRQALVDFRAISTANANTSQDIDRQLLEELISGMPGGYRGVDDKVQAQMCEWLQRELLQLTATSREQLLRVRTPAEIAKKEREWQAKLAAEFEAVGDTDGDGMISLDEAIAAFGGDERCGRAWLQAMDENGDGLVSDTATGDYTRAAEVFDECVKLREEILGLDYPDTKMAAQALQRCRGTAIVNLDKAGRERVDSALWSAAAAGNAALVQKMLQAGACPDIESDGFSALCMSAASGHVDTVMLLCERGADPDAVVKAEGDVCGATAMYLAAIGGNATIINLLIEAGGTVNAVLPQNGCTPLYIAADNGHVDVVRMLLAAGADLHRTSSTGASCVCAAARSGQSAVILVLANAGADLDLPMDNGATPAHLAAMAGQSEVIVTLHTLGADVEKAALVHGEEQTPVKLAQQYGQIETSEILNNLVSVTYHIIRLQARVRGKRRRRELEKLKAERT